MSKDTEVQAAEDALADLDIEIDDEELSEDTEEVSSDDEDAEEVPGEGEEEEDDGDEDDELEASDDEDSDEDDAEQYSAKVKKRIDRERRLRKKEMERAASIAAERDQARQLIQQLATQQLNERKALSERVAAAQDNQMSAMEENLTYRIDSLQQRLQRAKEEANASEEIKVSSELEDARFKKRQLDDVRGRLQQQRQHEMADIEDKLERAKKMSFGDTSVNTMAETWARKNRAWLEKPDNSMQVQFIAQIEQQLQREGFDPNSQAYYTALDKRIDSTFPMLRGKPRSKKKTARRKPVAAAVTNTRSQPARVAGKQRVKLNQADIANMQKFGLDPSKKEHLKQYAREKLANEAKGA